MFLQHRFLIIFDVFYHKIKRMKNEKEEDEEEEEIMMMMILCIASQH